MMIVFEGSIVASVALERTPAISQSAEERCQSYRSVPSVDAPALGCGFIKSIYFCVEEIDGEWFWNRSAAVVHAPSLGMR